MVRTPLLGPGPGNSGFLTAWGPGSEDKRPEKMRGKLPGPQPPRASQQCSPSCPRAQIHGDLHRPLRSMGLLNNLGLTLHNFHSILNSSINLSHYHQE